MCVPTPLATAVGTALAYSTYFELLCTLLILSVLLQLGLVKMVRRVSWNEVASGELSVDALAERIKQLESKGSRTAQVHSTFMALRPSLYTLAESCCASPTASLT